MQENSLNYIGNQLEIKIDARFRDYLILNLTNSFYDTQIRYKLNDLRLHEFGELVFFRLSVNASIRGKFAFKKPL